MTARFLTILNTLGCLALIGLVIAQWRKERGLESSLHAIVSERDSALQQVHALEERRKALENDISALKEALASTQKAAESAANELSSKSELAAKLQVDLDAAGKQVATWEQAVKDRDARIDTLHGELTKTRTRLDEAITKLKEAAARP